jgi:hypothetical protein
MQRKAHDKLPKMNVKMQIRCKQLCGDSITHGGNRIIIGRKIRKERGRSLSDLSDSFVPCTYFSLNNAVMDEPSCVVTVMEWHSPGFFSVCQL